MTTVTTVKRALEETLADEFCAKAVKHSIAHDAKNGVIALLSSSTALTILANRLSDIGEAGNKARERNLEDLRHLANCVESPGLEWAIEQLTPPTINH